MDKIDYCYKQINDKQELIRRTDAKASAVIVIVSVASSVFVAMLFKVAVTWQKHLAGLLFCLLVASLLLVDIVFVLMPRYKVDHSQSGTLEFFKKQIDSMTDEDLFNQLSAQIYKLNSVLEKKNRSLKIVFVLLLMLAALLIFVTFCAVF